MHAQPTVTLSVRAAATTTHTGSARPGFLGDAHTRHRVPRHAPGHGIRCVRLTVLSPMRGAHRAPFRCPPNASDSTRLTEKNLYGARSFGFLDSPAADHVGSRAGRDAARCDKPVH